MNTLYKFSILSLASISLMACTDYKFGNMPGGSASSSVDAPAPDNTQQDVASGDDDGSLPGDTGGVSTPADGDDGGGDNGGGSGGGGTKGPVVTRCDVLVDESGVYFNTSKKHPSYVAITGVTECAYNEMNHISGPCDPNVQVAILKPEDIGGLDNSDLTVDQGDVVAVIPQKGGPTFVCVSYAGRVVLSTKKFKIIVVAPHS